MNITIIGEEEVVKRLMNLLGSQRDLTLEKVKVRRDQERYLVNADLVHTPESDIRVVQLKLENGSVVKISLAYMV
jgi:hypothetical protein